MTTSRQTLTLRNDLAELPRLAEFVDSFCASLRPSDKDMMSLHLALEEIVTNIIVHGYRDGAAHTFQVALKTSDDERVSIVVTDDAPAFNPLERAPVDTTAPLENRAIGGLGVHLVRKLMDYCHYERRNGKNILTLERVIRPAS